MLEEMTPPTAPTSAAAHPSSGDHLLDGHEPPAERVGWRVALRTVNMLALALPVGGLAFFGIFAAPAIFRVARAASRAELAPQMVAQMLGRFGYVLIACAVLALICWGLDHPRPGSRDSRTLGLWWRVQGAASLLALGLTLFLQQGLMPRILAMQDQVLAVRPGASESALRATFDAVHDSYSSVARILLWASVAALACLARRGARE